MEESKEILRSSPWLTSRHRVSVCYTSIADAIVNWVTVNITIFLHMMGWPVFPAPTLHIRQDSGLDLDCLPFGSCVPLGRHLNLSVPQLPLCKMEMVKVDA